MPGAESRRARGRARGPTSPRPARSGTTPTGASLLNPVTAVVAVLAAGLWAALAHHWSGLSDPTAGQSPARLILLLVALSLAFVLTEAVQLHVELRRQALSLSLSEIPVVLGLFLVPPGGLLVCRLAGLLLVAWHRSTPSYKVSFNAATVTAEVAVLSLLFQGLGGHRAGLQAAPATWPAAYAALLVGTMLSGGLVVLAISRLQRVARADLLGLAAPLLVSALVNTTVALAALFLVQTDVRAWLLIAVLLVGGAVAYRAYGELLRRHRSLAQLQQLTEAWATADGVRDVVTALLVHGRPLLRAAHLEVLVRAPGAEAAATYDEGDDAPREGPSANGAALLEQVRAHGRTVVLLARRRPGVALLTRPAEHRLGVAETEPPVDRPVDLGGGRDAICVPLRHAGETLGALLVADRLGDTSTFDREDVELVELIATQAAVALQNGRLIDRLRHDATHDALTGLPNRAAFREGVSRALGASSRFCVLLMDLDRFKDVNDTLGHHQGDELLRAVATRLRDGLPEDVLVSRLGGDEFAVLVPDTSSAGNGLQVAHRLHATLTRPFRVDGVDLDVRASVGLSVAPVDGQDSSTLLKRADIAMYEAKTTGAVVKEYDATADRSSARRLALVAELRQAIGNDELACYYQPQLDLRDGRVVGAEALVRWPHPELGLVQPDDFIPVAEQTGLVVPLTTAVLRRALMQSSAWTGRGHPVGVAVNVSPRGLLATGFTEGVLQVLDETGTQPDRLTLEITENSVMADPARAVRVLTDLHDEGVQLSVDDFGTGYSSLAYLQRLPVDEVKIDKSFVRELGVDPDSAAIVRAIVDMGHILGLRVLAEGVEDEAVARLLLDLGCDLVQGFLYSRPLPDAEFRSFCSALASPTSRRSA